MSEMCVAETMKVGVCGAGAMGSGIAQVVAQSGHPVVIYDVSEMSRQRSEVQVSNNLNQLVKRGKLDKDAAARARAAMTWTGETAELADCDLVIEAIIEDIAVKQTLLAKLEECLGPEAIIASNTSSLPIARIARALQHPERFVGMHFFNPATVMKLVEVVSGPATCPAVAEKVSALAQSWGKIPVSVADVPGFIVNRVARPFYAEAFRCLQQSGGKPEVIDHLFKMAAGFRMGPLELTDLIGQDVNFTVARSIHESYFGQTRFVPQLVQSALVDANWLGRKTKRGIYDYAEGNELLVPQHETSTTLSSAPPMPEAFGPGSEGYEIDGVHIRCSRGHTAKSESRTLGKPVALIDWFAVETATAAGFAASDDRAASVAAGLLGSWGFTSFRLADRPGLVVLRTLAQIANAAGDAVLEGVSTAAGIDKALRFGANYPFGPIEWGAKIGSSVLVETLSAIASATGEAIYNPSEYWTNLE